MSHTAAVAQAAVAAYLAQPVGAALYGSRWPVAQPTGDVTIGQAYPFLDSMWQHAVSQHAVGLTSAATLLTYGQQIVSGAALFGILQAQADRAFLESGGRVG